MESVILQTMARKPTVCSWPLGSLLLRTADGRSGSGGGRGVYSSAATFNAALMKSNADNPFVQPTIKCILRTSTFSTVFVIIYSSF